MSIYGVKGLDGEEISCPINQTLAGWPSKKGQHHKKTGSYTYSPVYIAVQNFNKDPKNEPIRSVLMPGLGTAVGRMPYNRCAYQVSTIFVDI